MLADLTVNESGTMWMDGAKMALWCKTVVSIFVVVSIWQGLLCDMVHKEMVANVWAALKEVLKPTMLALRELMFALAYKEREADCFEAQLTARAWCTSRV